MHMNSRVGCGAGWFWNLYRLILKPVQVDSETCTGWFWNLYREDMGIAVGWENYVSPADIGNYIFLFYTINWNIFCFDIVHLYVYFFKLKICGEDSW